MNISIILWLSAKFNLKKNVNSGPNHNCSAMVGIKFLRTMETFVAFRIAPHAYSPRIRMETEPGFIRKQNTNPLIF